MERSEQKVHNPFEAPDHSTDIALVVEDRKLHFSKAVLSICSPVFHRMFNGDFIEKDAQEIPLPGKKYEDLVEFLKQIHPVYSHDSSLTSITDATLVSLLELAREYQVDHVRSRCEQYIGTAVAKHSSQRVLCENVDRLLLYLWVCDQFDLQRHRPTLVRLASQRKSRHVAHSKNFRCFPASSAMDVLNTRCDRLDNVLERVVPVIRSTCRSIDKLDANKVCHPKCLENRELGTKMKPVCHKCVNSKLKLRFQRLYSLVEDLHEYDQDV